MQPGPQSKSSRTGKGGFSDQDLVSLRPHAKNFFPPPRLLKHGAIPGREVQFSTQGSVLETRALSGSFAPPP
jgi:hypothetical protein